MRRTRSEDQEFDANLSALMKRLLDAGMILSFSKDKTPCVVWNKDYHPPLGGRAAFLGVASLLAELCQHEPLSEDEQAMIQMVRQIEETEESPEV